MMQNEIEMKELKKSQKNLPDSTWTGMVPVDDTALAVTDAGGLGIPVVYLNGQFATQGYWRKVIADLGPVFRHITYDERARGKKSRRSADYSFEAAIRDVDAVLAARGVERALVVGWSYGAFVAAHWASRNPDRCLGAILVDGAQPYDWMTEEMAHGMRKLLQAVELVHAAAASDGPDSEDERQRDGGDQYRARVARSRERARPRDGQRHRPDTVCACVGDVLRKQG